MCLAPEAKASSTQHSTHPYLLSLYSAYFCPSVYLSSVPCLLVCLSVYGLSIRLLTAHKYEYFRPANEENRANLSPLVHNPVP
jgi:hypothetical protein